MEHLKYLNVLHYNNKIRLGCKKDGGYVIANVPKYDCYISAGVSNEESFSRDFINKFKMNKYNSFAFDGTIKSYPYKYTKNITFIKKNISSHKNNKKVNLHGLINHYNNIFLKMDIEGCEYDWLLSLNENKLNKFKQIVIELHGINDDSWGISYNKKIECLKLLSKTHHIIHIHGNNCSRVQNGIPDVMEVTFVRKQLLNETILNCIPLPIKDLDYPCNTKKPDIVLNCIPFITNSGNN